MVKEDIRALLNTSGAQHHVIVNTIAKYIMEMPQKANIANYIVLEAKKRRDITPLDLFKFFFTKTQELVKGTAMCRTLYAEQMILKSIWEVSRFQALVTSLIRSGQLLEVPELVEQDGQKRVKRAETPSERELRLAKQAERMREAKAKRHMAPAPAQLPDKSIPKKQSNLDKEQLARIEMLRNL